MGPYARPIKQLEDDLKSIVKAVNELKGIKESDTGLAPPSQWDLVADQQLLQSEHPLQVARNTKIINADSEEPKYVINIKQVFVPRASKVSGNWPAALASGATNR